MRNTIRLLGLDAARWNRVGPESIWSAMAIVIVASTLLALNRFGGLAATSPRPFVKLVLIGVWGWIALGLAVWMLGSLLTGPGRQSPFTSLTRTLAAVGLAHAPVIALTVVVFVAADLMQFFGPGFVTAAIVFSAWFPAWLLVGTRAVLELSIPKAGFVVAVAYGAWLHVIGRHLLGQIAHLL